MGRYTDKLRVRAQVHPDIYKVWQVFGKIADWAATLPPTLEAKATWAPDYKVTIATSEEEGMYGVKPMGDLCQITTGGKVSWNESALAIAGFNNPEEANAAVAAFRRPRK